VNEAERRAGKLAIEAVMLSLEDLDFADDLNVEATDVLSEFVGALVGMVHGLVEWVADLEKVTPGWVMSNLGQSYEEDDDEEDE
jgi:hypothetical protein